jgi:hypothetical protein
METIVMADSKSAKNVDSRVVALAEKLGWMLGTVQRQADQLPDRAAVTKQLRRIRDGATSLLARVERARAARMKQIAKRKKKANPKASRGPVDAPGKRHRKPPPQEKVDLHKSGPAMKRLGKKSLQAMRAPRRG